MTIPGESGEAVTRSVAQFFFEVGFGACFADAMIHNDLKPPFELTDAHIEAAFLRSIEAHEDGAEMDRYLALAHTEPRGPEVSRALYEAAVAVSIIRPSNWDDEEDEQQVDAWRMLDRALEALTPSTKIGEGERLREALGKAVSFSAYRVSDPLAIRFEFASEKDRLAAANAVDEVGL